MKTISIFILVLTFSSQNFAQNREELKFLLTEESQILTGDSVIKYAIRLVLINQGDVNYYYGKSLNQSIENNNIRNKFNYSLKYNKERFLSFDISSTSGRNTFDTLIAIKPGDTLVISYVNINLPKRSNVVCVINELFTLDSLSNSISKNGVKYFDKFGCAVNKLNITLEKKKNRSGLKKSVEIVNPCPTYGRDVAKFITYIN